MLIYPRAIVALNARTVYGATAAEMLLGNVHKIVQVSKSCKCAISKATLEEMGTACKTDVLWEVRLFNILVHDGDKRHGVACSLFAESEE